MTGLSGVSAARDIFGDVAIWASMLKDSVFIVSAYPKKVI
jgi:hypothetical protein